MAASLYLGLTVALTWPLAAGLAHDVPGDFGDPLFTSWVLAWDATHLGRGWWNANIFAPHPLALAYSEHFLPQALQAMPFYLATQNPILGYNVIFLSTFVLSALGMYLFARELTGSRPAALVAGLAFAFAPYRIASIPHLQVLSSAWMPFVLYGLRRYFTTGRIRPLAGAAAAWILQNLSCGYYLLFFSPIVFFYIVWELTARRRWTDRRAVTQIAIACAAVVAATLPFLLPYLELRRLGFMPRSIDETRRFSADVYAYFTADPNLRLWGTFGPFAQAWPRAEGLLFPGLTIVALAIVGAGRGGDRGPEQAARQAGRERSAGRAARQIAIAVLGLVIAWLLLGFSIRLPGIKVTSLGRVLIIACVAGVARLATSRSARASLARWLASPVGFFSLITLFSIAMSFGPDIHAKGRAVAGTNIYMLFYNAVPGFDGLRVPARYAMIAALGLAALAAFGVASSDRRYQRRIALAAGALIVVEAFAVPIPINQSSTDYRQAGLAPLPASIATGAATPAVYRYIATLPPSAVIIELPLGEPAFDLRYTFYSINHWRPLVNGYSGGAPLTYQFLTEALKDVASRPDRAWQAIVDSTATHAVVHEASYAGGRGRAICDFFRAHRATEVSLFDTDRVFSLRESRVR